MNMARRSGSSVVPTLGRLQSSAMLLREVVRQYALGLYSTIIDNVHFRRALMAERLETVDAIVEKYAVVSSPIKSKIYIGLGSIFVIFSIIGIWIPGWPTVSWAVPAAFLFSLSNEKLFRWTLTNRFFGPSMFEYYATGKTLPRHVKIVIASMIGLMTTTSAYFVWYVSTRGDGTLMDLSSWNGADNNAYGAITILFVGILGMAYVLSMVKSRE